MASPKKICIVGSGNWGSAIAKIVGENKENADIVVSPYPSDHRAVVATFTLANQTQAEQGTKNQDKDAK